MFQISVIIILLLLNSSLSCVYIQENRNYSRYFNCRGIYFRELVTKEYNELSIGPELVLLRAVALPCHFLTGGFTPGNNCSYVSTWELLPLKSSTNTAVASSAECTSKSRNKWYHFLLISNL
jgi:hypothetical protein